MWTNSRLIYGQPFVNIQLCSLKRIGCKLCVKFLISCCKDCVCAPLLIEQIYLSLFALWFVWHSLCLHVATIPCGCQGWLHTEGRRNCTQHLQWQVVSVYIVIKKRFTNTSLVSKYISLRKNRISFNKDSISEPARIWSEKYQKWCLSGRLVGYPPAS